MQVWWYFVQLIFRVVLITLFNIRVYGRKNVPVSGGLLVASNHQSYLDPILIGAAIDRRLCFMARRTLFRNRLFGALLSSLCAFPVERDYADLSSIRKAMNLLNKGEAVLIFPEGTRSGDGNIGKLKSGIGLLAKRANVSIIPVLIEGSYEIWSRNNLLPSYGKINIIWGKAFVFYEHDNVTEKLYELLNGLKRVNRRQI